MLVLASMSPVFLVWGILGMDKIPDLYFGGFCLLMILVPHFFLLRRINVSKRNSAYKQIRIKSGKDSKEQLLTYFLPLILPLMGATFDSWRGFSATLVLFSIMAFASWHLGIFYINIFFALFGFRIFTIIQVNSDQETVLISRREQISPDDTLNVLRLTNRVFYDSTSNKHA